MAGAGCHERRGARPLGGDTMSVHGALPIEAPTRVLYGKVVVAALTCLLCGRCPASVHRVDARTPVIKVHRPEYADDVRRLRCPDCSGRLMLTAEEDHLERRVPLTAEDLAGPRRGRPRKGRLL